MKKNRQVRMNYRSGTGVRCYIWARQTFSVHSPRGSTFCVKWRHRRHLESMMSYPKSDSVNRYNFTWGIFLPNFIARLKLFWGGHPNNKNKNINSNQLRDE